MAAAVEDPALPGIEAGGLRRSKKSVKWVTCIVRPEKLDVVTDSLNKLNLVGGMTVTEVRGSGSGSTEPDRLRPRYVAPYSPHVKIEVAIEDGDVNEVEAMIKKLAKTGEVGDGKVFIFNVIDLMRIRTGERGVSAL